MIRNSILYRRWWYIKRRNIKKIRLLLRLALAAMIMWIIAFFVQNNLLNNLFSVLGF